MFMFLIACCAVAVIAGTAGIIEIVRNGVKPSGHLSIHL